MNIDIADTGDIDSLAELLGILFSQDIEFTPDFIKQKEGIAAILSDKNIGRIFVLRDGAVLVGMVSLLYSVSTALGGKVAVLEDMFVRQEYRNRGCGSMLIEAALDYAKANGLQRITLLTDEDNHGAQRFYLSHGFKRSTMIPMRRLL
ncbi:MAG TPA: GNAT family N-acetyltransferase [Spirochaetota bacterium]|nr:GNAT family N-acetyltransferase [Spirochaetota bacterium]